MTEKELHSKIKSNESLQEKLCNCIGIDFSSSEFISEDQFPNGMMVDFSVVSGNEVQCLIELKGSSIGINEFVRGTGQVFQYQHFIDTKQSVKGYDFNENAFTALVFPLDVLRSGSFNLGLMTYPRRCRLIEYDDEHEFFREITDKELKKMSGERGKNVVSISQYYIRDNRLFELFIAIKYIALLELNCIGVPSRKEMDDFLSTIDVPNKGNWRNAFISLASLGFTQDSNRLTDSGRYYAMNDYDVFVVGVYYGYIRPYIDLLQETLKSLKADETDVCLSDLKSEIDNSKKGNEVLYLTDSDQRYLSSWLNIMRDDFCCIDFPDRKSNRKYKLNYVVSDLNEKAIRNQVCYNFKAYQSIKDFMEKFKAKYLK